MTRIIVSGYDVELVQEDLMDEFIVKFKGPEDSPYAGVSKNTQKIIVDRVSGR